MSTVQNANPAETDARRLQAVQDHIRLLEVQERIKTLETPAPKTATPAAPTPQQTLEARPIVGTQRIMGMDVPIRQPGTLAEQQAAPPGTQAQPPTDTLKGAAAMGINAAGAAAGTALGTATSPVTGIIGPIVGEMAGSYGARKLNVALGLEEPGMMGDVLSVAVPPVVRGVGALIKPAVRRLPGAAASLHEDVAGRLQALPETMRPATPSRQLYALAARQSPPIPSQQMQQRATNLLAREQRLQPSLQNAQILRVAEDMQALTTQHNGAIPLDLLHETQQRLGLLLRQAKAENWPQESGLRQLYGAIYADLDQAAARGVPGAQTLLAANRAARQEFAVEDLATMFAPGHPGIMTRVDGLVTLNGGKLRDTFEKRIANDELFAGSFTPEQLRGIRTFFTEAEGLPRVPPPRGQSFGSGMTIARGGGAYVGAKFLGFDDAAAAATATAAAAIPHLFAQGMMTDTGRRILLAVLRANGGISPATLGLLSSAGRQTMNQGTTAVTGTTDSK